MFTDQQKISAKMSTIKILVEWEHERISIFNHYLLFNGNNLKYILSSTMIKPLWICWFGEYESVYVLASNVQKTFDELSPHYVGGQLNCQLELYKGIARVPTKYWLYFKLREICTKFRTKATIIITLKQYCFKWYHLVRTN